MSYVLRMKVPSGELELHGPRSDLDSAINNLPKIVDSIRSAFGVTPVQAQPAIGNATPDDSASLPFIERPEGLNDAIVKALSTGWGMNPRKWSEIDLALKQSALNYSRGSITSALAYLVRSGRLRRVPINGVYGYQIPVHKHQSNPQISIGPRVSVSPGKEIETEESRQDKEVRIAGQRGKAETSVILQEVEEKLLPDKFFNSGRTTREVKSALEKATNMKFQSRKVSQALGRMYSIGKLRRTGSKGEFTYIAAR